MPPAPGPEEAYQWYEQEIDLLTSAARTGAPTQDIHSAFPDRGGVPAGPPFAIQRSRALIAELVRLDPAFPR